MSKGKLTRQELGWLLTQEAQGAAERLRKGVTALTQPPPSGAAAGADGGDGGDPSAVDATLSALDDTMRMLSSLHARPSNQRGRRGRIDLAALVWEVAPEARVSIEPGGGTEVHGDEAELRRMLHVLLGHGGGSGSAVTIRRERDEVVIGVTLGPDSSITAETERAWLARMAIRYGGRYELVGNQELLGLPAEGVDARDDVAKLRKELDEARKQGEAYARELAQVWTSGDEPPVAQSSYPPPASPAADRHGAVARLSGGVAATLRSLLSPIGREVAELKPSGGPRKSSPDLDVASRAAAEDPLDPVRRRLLAAQEFVADLAAVGETDPNELQREVDLVEIVRHEVRAVEGRLARAGVEVAVTTVPEDASARAYARVSPKSVAAMIRALLGHAIAASPKGSTVRVAVVAAGQGAGTETLGTRLTVEDAGTVLPAGARRPLLGLEVEPGTYGRPSAVGLYLAAEIAAAQGALLEIGDAQADDPAGPRGVRVHVTFPR